MLDKFALTDNGIRLDSNLSLHSPNQETTPPSTLHRVGKNLHKISGFLDVSLRVIQPLAVVFAALVCFLSLSNGFLGLLCVGFVGVSSGVLVFAYRVREREMRAGTRKDCGIKI
ncbi:UNVERIFIED_CONTAM: hypothetical protein HDU68_002448 [Siphonaria sp. JEL0065]|nr:hypothetical protein HDU68_002448 [Siphonaria sp. JEL0065]